MATGNGRARTVFAAVRLLIGRALDQTDQPRGVSTCPAMPYEVAYGCIERFEKGRLSGRTIPQLKTPPPFLRPAFSEMLPG